MPKFTGFDTSTLEFLRDLEANNNREWFNANKSRYEALVLEPALDFIATIAPALHRISDHFDAVPKRSGGSLMRIYRDTRFSKDKTPYKTNIGIQFRHQLGKDVHAPGYYLHIEPQECFVGVGMWHPESEALRRIRDRIVANPTAWRRAVTGKTFGERFALEGESLQRPPRGFDADHPYIDDLKRKDHIAVSRFSSREITSADFVQRITATFKVGTPYMKFLCASLDVAF